MEMKFRALLSLAVVLLVASLMGCGGHYKCGTTFGNATCNGSGSGIGGGTGTGTTIAAGNAAVLTYFLSGNTLDAAGFGGSTFAGLSGYTAPTLPSGFADLMTIVNKQFVYVPMGDTTIQGFSINRSTGALTPIPGSPFQTNGGGTTDGAWSDPKGRFLFVGSEATNSIWVFTIDPKTGALTETAGSPYSTGFIAADIMAVDASGKFLYAGQLTPSAGVAGFSIDQTTGALAQIPGSPFNLGIAQIRTTPTGEFLMGVQEIQDQGSLATDNHVYVYSINTISGVPTPVSGSPFVTTAAPYDLTIFSQWEVRLHAGGQWHYVGSSGRIPDQYNDGGSHSVSGSPFSSLPVVTQCQFDRRV